MDLSKAEQDTKSASPDNSGEKAKVKEEKTTTEQTPNETAVKAEEVVDSENDSLSIAAAEMDKIKILPLT